jgi:peptidoglycan/LPS O-acetylase OafA/YrhL
MPILRANATKRRILGTFRMLLAVCVLLTHSASKDLPHLLGTFAVESFFVISGFYMALVLTEKYTRANLGDSWAANFYLSRYLRLYPIYILSALARVLLAVFVVVVIGRSAIFEAWTQLLSLPLTVRNVLLIIWAMVSNLTIFFYDLVPVIAVHDHQAVLTTDPSLTQINAWDLTANVLAWSLGVELTFYLLAPYLLKRSNRQLFGLLLLGAALKIWAIIHIDGDLPYRLFPFVFVNFLCGVLAYRLRSVLGGFARKYAPLICYCLMLALLFALPTGWRYWEYSLLTIGVTALILPTLFNYSGSSHFDNRLAEFSYPFYLLHPLALSLVYSTLIKRAGITNDYLIFACETALTLAFAYVVLSLEARYVEPYRQRLGRPRVTLSVATQ